MRAPILMDEKAGITWKKRIYSIPGMKIWEEPALVITPLQYQTGFIPGQSSPLDTFNPELRKIFTLPQFLSPRGTETHPQAAGKHIPKVRTGKELLDLGLDTEVILSAAGTGEVWGRFWTGFLWIETVISTISPLPITFGHFWCVDGCRIFLHFMCSNYSGIPA